MLNTIYLENTKNVQVTYYLQKIYGIGKLSSQLICKTLGYDINVRTIELNSRDWEKIQSIIKIKYKFDLDNDVKKKIIDNIQEYKNIKCYKGIRHTYGLPVNGRRTRRNAKTIGWR